MNIINPIRSNMPPLDDTLKLRVPPMDEPAPVEEKFSDSFAVTVSCGSEWVDISHGDMWINPEGFGTSSVSWRKEQAQSRFYHGSYIIHGVKDNVQETLSIYIRSHSNNDVTEHLAMLEELFSQFTFQVRVQFGNHRETWYCQTADGWQVDRSHVLMHNSMAKFTVTLSRLPETTKEIIL